MPGDELLRAMEAQASKFFGKYRGTVVDDQDSQMRGRLRVQVPQVLGASEVWALPCVPYAGKDEGFFALPKKGTTVWVEFEAGDPSFPIWTGALWALGDISPQDAVPGVKFIKTKKFTLRIDDELGEVLMENSSGSKITIGPLEIKIEASTVKNEAAGGKKTEMSAVSYNVNSGALEVL